MSQVGTNFDVMTVLSLAKVLSSIGVPNISAHPKALAVLFVSLQVAKWLAIAFAVVTAWWTIVVVAVIFKVLTGK